MQNSAVKAILKSDRALVAQLVERVLGKDEVTGSSPVIGSRFLGLRTRRCKQDDRAVDE